MNATPKKNSGIAWIGEVPASWEFQRLKYKATLAGRIGWQGLTSEEYRDEGVHLVTGTDFEDGRINWNTCVRISNERWAEATQVQLEEGDLLITKDGTVGKVAIVKDLPGKASLNSGVMVIRKRASISTEFLFWLLQSTVFTGWFNDVNAGASTIAHLYQADFYNFSFYLPPKLAEQEQIARALQTQVAKIDRALNLLQQELDTLDQLKKSMIHEAVTKGLDPTVPMKPSGVEWIGDIPEHWRTTRIKYIAPAWNGLTYDPADVGDTGTPVLRSGNIQNGELDLQDLVRVVGSIPEKALAQSGDILICSRNGSRNLIGKNTLIQQDGYAFGAFMMIARPTVNSRYFHYVLNSGVFDFYLPTYLTSTVNQLTGTNFGNMVVPLTDDPDEQLEINAELNAKCKALDAAMKKKRAQLSLLRKQRESLIFEYVTGKRRVNEVA